MSEIKDVSTLRGFADDLNAWLDRPAVRLGDLPDGHGLGKELDDVLDGGLRPGDLVLIGAGSAGGGRTLLTMQLADGLALAAAAASRSDAGLLTPVVVCSEMPWSELRARTLARLLGCSPSVSSLRARRDDVASLVAAENGPYADMREWRYYARAEGRGADILDAITTDVKMWTTELRRRHPGREVVPVVVLDSLHRLMDSTLDEMTALRVLAEQVDLLAEQHGWIVLATADTTKPAADWKAEANALSATVFRGSYKLMHAADVAMVLALRGDGGATFEPSLRLVKNRRGPEGATVSLAWNSTSLRISPRKWTNLPSVMKSPLSRR